jgi:regulator of protease activity HflC (stomatin/prohibitin superfamily)
MNRQANAERMKRESILTSQGVRQKLINEAEGRRQSEILDSEGT